MGFLKRFLVSFVVIGSLLAQADPDCENLKDRADELDQCCQEEPIIPMKDADDCAAAAAEAQDPHEKMMCPIQCKLQSLGVLNGQEIVQEKVREYANRLEGDWKNLAKAVTDSCLEKVVAMNEMLQDRARGLKCSPIGGLLMMCLVKLTIEQCPADKFTNSGLCNKFKSGECFKNRYE